MLDLSKMKKILIVNTRSQEKKLAGFVMWGAWSVASCLKFSIPGSDVIYLDENNEDDFEGKFIEAIKDRDTVGFSLTSMQIKYSLPLIRQIKRNYPNIRIIIGGIHPVLFPKQDYGPLVDEVITYDLPKDKFLYELLPERVKEYYRKSRAHVITGFNCSYKCTFCVNSVRNCTHEGVPLETILKDLDYVVKEFKPKRVYFRDEDFFFDIGKAKAITDHIIEKKYGFAWEAASRVTNFFQGRVDDEFLRKLKLSGCYLIGFGVESGSQRILNYLRKGQTIDQVRHAVKQCVKYGITPSCSFLIGVPNETAADREETYRLIEELSGYGKDVNILGPQLYRPYPGGQLFEEAVKFGLKFPEKFEDWEHYYDDNKNPAGSVFDTKADYPWLTKKENKLLPNVFVVAHYGLNYVKSDDRLKRLIGRYFKLHWRFRWFGGLDLKLFMYIRKKMLKSEI